MKRIGKIVEDEFELLQQHTLDSLKTETSPARSEAKLPQTQTEKEGLSEEGIRYLAKISDRQLEPDYAPSNPHEAMAIELIRAALSGDKTARRTYWDLQERIYTTNAKTKTPNVQIEIKKDTALSKALDNIQAKVMEGEIAK